MKKDIKTPSEDVIIIKINKLDNTITEFLFFRISEIMEIVDIINIKNVVVENKISCNPLKAFVIILFKPANPKETIVTELSKIASQ